MNRLKELRKEKKLTQKELADILKINEKTISRWENNESTIKSNKAEALANYFNVSIGYLLGFTNVSSPNTEELVFIDWDTNIIDGVEILPDTNQEQLERFVEFLYLSNFIISDKEIEYILSLLREMDIFNSSSVKGDFLFRSLKKQSFNKTMEELSKRGYGLLASQFKIPDHTD